jgi:hypothetical protein
MFCFLADISYRSLLFSLLLFSLRPARFSLTMQKHVGHRPRRPREIHLDRLVGLQGGDYRGCESG